MTYDLTPAGHDITLEEKVVDREFSLLDDALKTIPEWLKHNTAHRSSYPQEIIDIVWNSGEVQKLLAENHDEAHHESAYSRILAQSCDRVIRWNKGTLRSGHFKRKIVVIDAEVYSWGSDSQESIFIVRKPDRPNLLSYGRSNLIICLGGSLKNISCTHGRTNYYIDARPSGKKITFSQFNPDPTKVSLARLSKFFSLGNNRNKMKFIRYTDPQKKHLWFEYRKLRKDLEDSCLYNRRRIRKINNLQTYLEEVVAYAQEPERMFDRYGWNPAHQIRKDITNHLRQA